MRKISGAQGATSVRRLALGLGFLAASFALSPGQTAAGEPPDLSELVSSGKLPPMAQRLPKEPQLVDLAANGLETGRYGGRLRTLIAKAKSIRYMNVYGYARLMGYSPDLRLKPDLLRSVEVKEGRIFTLTLRRGHKWSDGAPFTTEDFRYY
ncbi:MAG: ABC transporter substrate-binding protein, partial [Alphaproteobacteria bacterium]